MNLHFLVREIIEKEFDRYELADDKLIEDYDKMAHRLMLRCASSVDVLKNEEQFLQWKEELCHVLYKDINYPTYIRRKKNTPGFRSFIKRLFQNIVDNLRRTNKKQTIDKELKLPSAHTVAYKLSVPLFSALYEVVRDDKRVFMTPIYMEQFCEELAEELFPIDYPHLMELLEKDDREFWNEMLVVIRRLVGKVLFAFPLPKAEYADVCEEVSMETCAFLHKQLTEKKLEHIVSAFHLCNSLSMAAKHKLMEYFSRQKKWQEEVTDEVFPEPEDEDDADAYTQESHSEADMLYDADIHNERDLSCAILYVIRQGQGRNYELLMGPHEEKFRVLIMHLYSGMSYEEICLELYGELPEANRQKACKALRKTASRARPLLKERIKWLVRYVQGEPEMLKKLTK